MDAERLAQTTARFAVAAARRGARPAWVVPPNLRHRVGVKSVEWGTASGALVAKLNHDRPLSVDNLAELKEALSGGDADGYGGEPMRRWVSRVLACVKAQTPVGVTGEPITWAEAVAAEHPLVVATKSATDPAWRHLIPDAHNYLAMLVDEKAASGSLKPLDALPGERMSRRADREQTGAIVAFIPSAYWKRRLATIGDEPAENLHVTLHYPGQVADLDDDGLEKLLPRIRAIAASHPPIRVRVAGLATFNPTGDEPAHVLILNHPHIAKVHEEVTEVVETSLAAPLVEQHRPFIPHLTLQYGGNQPPVPDAVFDQPLVLDYIRLGWGNIDVDIPLKGRTPK